VPADTGYVVTVLAFHGNDVMDALGSTHDDDTTITVLPAGGPIYQNTQVHVTMYPGPFSMPWVWEDAESTWGCSVDNNGNCATPSYLALVPNTPGVMPLAVTYLTHCDDRVFSVASDTIHITIDQGAGGIDVTFNRHHH
jgi:hypothetical protein